MLFPKSEKVVSEKLSTDEFNVFAADAEELSKRLEAQEEGNTAEKSDREKAEAQVTEIQGKLTTAEAQVTEIQGKLTTVQSELTTLKTEKEAVEKQLGEKDEYITKLKASINPLGEEDESNKADANGEVLTDTDKAARASYNKSKSAL